MITLDFRLAKYFVLALSRNPSPGLPVAFPSVVVGAALDVGTVAGTAFLGIGV